jgi:hypothetical protein
MTPGRSGYRKALPTATSAPGQHSGSSSRTPTRVDTAAAPRIPTNRATSMPSEHTRTPRDARHRSDQNVADRLIGSETRPVILKGSWERPSNLRHSAGSNNGRSGPGDAEGTTLSDASQHKAFRDHQPELEAKERRAIGISSQCPKSQRAAADANLVMHTLLNLAPCGWR